MNGCQPNSSDVQVTSPIDLSARIHSLASHSLASHSLAKPILIRRAPYIFAEILAKPWIADYLNDNQQDRVTRMLCTFLNHALGFGLQEIGGHAAFAFHFDFPSRFENVMVFQPSERGFTDLNVSR